MPLEDKSIPRRQSRTDDRVRLERGHELFGSSISLPPAGGMATFSEHRSEAIRRYMDFVADGRNQPEPWEKLKN